MDETAVVPMLAWLAVAGTTTAAVLFGQSAREAADPYPVGGVPGRVRLGIALSISGPLLAFLVGIAGGLSTDEWLTAATAAFAGVVAAAVAGWFLAPR